MRKLRKYWYWNYRLYIIINIKEHSILLLHMWLWKHKSQILNIFPNWSFRKPDMEMTVYIKKDSQHNNNYNGAICFKHVKKKRMMNMFLHITMQLKWFYAIKRERHKKTETTTEWTKSGASLTIRTYQTSLVKRIFISYNYTDKNDFVYVSDKGWIRNKNYFKAHIHT